VVVNWTAIAELLQFDGVPRGTGASWCARKRPEPSVGSPMTKKTFVPLGIVALLVVLLAFLLNEGDSPVPVDFELSFAEETSSTEPWVEAGRAEPTVSQGPVVDLGEGNAAISGKVIEPQGGVAGGARVALLRSSLLASVEQEGGVSMWNVVDFGRVFSSSNHLSSLMPLRARSMTCGLPTESS